MITRSQESRDKRARNGLRCRAHTRGRCCRKVHIKSLDNRISLYNNFSLHNALPVKINHGVRWREKRRAKNYFCETSEMNHSGWWLVVCLLSHQAHKKVLLLPLIPPAGTLKKQRNYRNSDETRVVFTFKLGSFQVSSSYFKYFFCVFVKLSRRLSRIFPTQFFIKRFCENWVEENLADAAKRHERLRPQT